MLAFGIFQCWQYIHVECLSVNDSFCLFSFLGMSQPSSLILDNPNFFAHAAPSSLFSNVCAHLALAPLIPLCLGQSKCTHLKCMCTSCYQHIILEMFLYLVTTVSVCD